MEKTGENCICIKHRDGKFIINPPFTTPIRAGMRVIVLGTREQITDMKTNVDRTTMR